jgi:hypothetical protein
MTSLFALMFSLPQMGRKSRLARGSVSLPHAGYYPVFFISMAKQLICSACGHVGSGKNTPKGSLGVEILLWLFFIIPGLIYSIWRQSSYHKACPVCGSANLIPVDSPVGQKLLKDQGKTVEQAVAESKEASGQQRNVLMYVGGGFVALAFLGYIISSIAS